MSEKVGDVQSLVRVRTGQNSGHIGQRILRQTFEGLDDSFSHIGHDQSHEMFLRFKKKGSFGDVVDVRPGN